MKFQKGDMVAPAPRTDARQGRQWRRLGLVVGVQPEFFERHNGPNLDRVWVRWFHPVLGITEVESWPSTILRRP